MIDFLGFRLGLPAPLDSVAGDFLLLLSIWIVAAALAVVVLDQVVRRLVGFTDSDLDDQLLRVSRAPMVAVILLYGFQSTFAFVAEFSVRMPVVGLGTVTEWVAKLSGLAVALTLLVWAYRALDQVLIHYAHKWAETTDTKIDDALVPVGEKALMAIIIFFGFTTILGTFGIDITMLVAGAGLLGLVVAFAAQDTLSNFFSGIFLLLDRPFEEGDWVNLQDGRVVKVRRVGLRSTRFYHKYDHTIITIPNRIIAEDEITDLMKPDDRYRQNVQIGVAYGSDVGRVTEIMDEVIRGHPNVLTEPEDLAPWILFKEHGDSALVFVALFWVDHVDNRWAVKDDITRQLNAAFREADIKIPFPQRDVWFKNPAKAEIESGDFKEAPSGEPAQAE